jgi:hypothetical protein
MSSKPISSTKLFENKLIFLYNTLNFKFIINFMNLIKFIIFKTIKEKEI